VLPQLGISAFTGDGQSAGMAEVIQNDLALADVAVRPANKAAAEAAAAGDQRAGSVQFDGWTAAGVTYVVRGRVSGGEGQLELYDAVTKQRLLGQAYSGALARDPRRLAHRMADDIMAALTQSPGIFSTRIAFLSDRGPGRKEVSVMDADGAGVRQLTNESALVSAPAWGLNGTEIYFTSYRDNNPDLYGITLDGRRFEISRRPGLNTSPSWCEALGRLAVSLSKDGNSEIYTMSRDGRDLARLTNSPDADTAPAWSPDGSRIAFTSDRSGQPQIYLMDASGGPARLVSHGGYCDSAAWSPDGRRLAYVAREQGEFNIYMVDIAGGGPAIQLTRGQRDNRDPSWGPSSKHLVFSSNRSGRHEIYMMNTDTRVAKQLTRTGGATSPVWGPPTR
jgi:TolB protein